MGPKIIFSPRMWLEPPGIFSSPDRSGRLPGLASSGLRSGNCDSGWVTIDFEESRSEIRFMTETGSNCSQAAQSCYSKLGRTGMDIFKVGFGMWQIAGGRWKSPDDEACVSMLREAADRGVNV